VPDRHDDGIARPDRFSDPVQNEDGKGGDGDGVRNTLPKLPPIERPISATASAPLTSEENTPYHSGVMDTVTNMGKLDGKVAVITAGSSGMALATAKLFVEEGAYVFITGRDQDKLDKAVEEIGRNVTGVQADSSKLADLDSEEGERSYRCALRKCGAWRTYAARLHH